MGASRKPTSRKVLQGTFRKDQEHEIPQPRYVEKVKEPPSHLGKHGRQLWKDLACELVELGMITILDWATFELCCSSYDLYLEAKELISKPMNKTTGRPKGQSLGEYLEEGSGREIRIMNQSFDRYMTAVKALGLSPSARKNIVIPEPKTDEISVTERILNEMYEEANGKPI
jgi:P27 family predicted phage terminase small subunit